MSKEIRNIDEFIKQGLNDFHAPPPADAWDNIAQQVQAKERKLLPVFWRYAAALAIIIGLGFVLKTQLTKLEQKDLSQSEIFNTVDVEQIQKDNTKETSSKVEKIESVNNNTSRIPIQNKFDQKSFNPKTLQKINHAVDQQSDKKSASNNMVADMKQPKSTPNNKKSEQQNILDTKRLIAENIPPDQNHDAQIKGDDNEDTESETKNSNEVQSLVLVNKNGNTKPEKVSDKKDHSKQIPALPKDSYADNEQQANWSVGGGVSPVYSFRNLSKEEDENSYIWPGGDNNELNEHPIVAFSGGLDVEYQKNRWSFSTGLYYSQSGQETNNFNFNRVLIFNTQTNIYASTSAGNIAYEQVSSGLLEHFNIDGDNPSILEALGSEPIESDAILRQDFEYLEIPLMAKYKLIDRKVDVQFLAGVSTSILMSNSNVLQYSGKELDMGKIESLRDVNYNSLVGLGFQYPFTHSLRFRLQPVFKYALRPLNEDYSIRNYPYSFAVYTGIAFDF
jgi:hypothetical protein